MLGIFGYGNIEAKKGINNHSEQQGIIFASNQ